MAREEMQQLKMKDRMEDTLKKWNDCYKDNVEWGAGIADMAAKVQANATVHKAAVLGVVSQQR